MFSIFRCLKDYRSGGGVTCPNHLLCQGVTWKRDDQEALDIKAQMDEYIDQNLNGNWRRLVRKVEDQHCRLPSLRKLSKKQRKRRLQIRSKNYFHYEKKFPMIYNQFPNDDSIPYTPSVTADMPKQVTMSYGLYNNIAYYPEQITESQKRYLIGK